MTTDVDAQALRARANALGWGEQPSGRMPRRRGRIAAGVTLLVVSGWVAAVIFTTVGRRQEVLVLARSVDRYDELSTDDLRVARVAADPGVGVVRAERLGDLVGRVAATDLVEGSLLHEDELVDVDERVVAEGESVVGAVLAAGDAPVDLSAGASVEVVVRSPAGSSAGPESVRAWVLDVREAGTPGVESQRVSLVVPSDRVALVSAAASEGRVSVAVVGGG